MKFGRAPKQANIIEGGLRNYLFRLVELHEEVERGMRNLLRWNSMIIDEAAAIVEQEKTLKLRDDLPPEINRLINERIAERQQELQLTPALTFYLISPLYDDPTNQFNSKALEARILNEPYILSYMVKLFFEMDHEGGTLLRSGIPTEIVDAIRAEWNRQKIEQPFPGQRIATQEPDSPRL